MMSAALISLASRDKLVATLSAPCRVTRPAFASIFNNLLTVGRAIPVAVATSAALARPAFAVDKYASTSVP